MDIGDEKAALRAKAKLMRRLPGPEEKALSDAAIAARLTELPEYAAAGTVFCFVGTKREIDTEPIILRAMKDGKRVAVPRCTGPGVMEARVIACLGELTGAGPFGIREPDCTCPLLRPGDVDLAVVPCLACGRDCTRLGHGGGYYDRFLKAAGFFSAALCREALLFDSVPTEAWDAPVDCVVTENGVIRRK